MRTRADMRISAVVWLALGVIGSAAAAQQGSVTGKVTDEADGRPLAGARVQGVTQQVSALTNQSGQYTIRGVTPGTQTLRVFALGYASQTRSVTISGGAPTTIDWALKATPFQLETIDRGR